MVINDQAGTGAPSAAVATAWEQRVFTKTTRRKEADGGRIELCGPRQSAANCLPAVRSFYLDIAQWASDDPARWGRPLAT